MYTTAPESVEEQEFFLNGVNALTGGPLFEPLTVERVVNLAGAEFDGTPRSMRDLVKGLSERKSQAHFGFDVDDLGNPRVGRWGVIFAEGEDTAVRKEIERLIAHRETVLGIEPRIFELSSDTGVVDFLRDNGVERGIGKVKLVPYHLLIVGDPGKISFRFQMELNTEYATGRLHFESPRDYAAYIDSLIDYEDPAHSVPNRRALDFWAPERPVDPSTSKSAPQLAQPLFDACDPDHTFARRMFRGFGNQTGVGPASRDALRDILAGTQPPALLFTASHGMGYPEPDPRQPRENGALVTQEYVWRNPIEPGQFYTGEDLEADLKNGGSVRGLIHFAFACFGAGTPQFDDFAHGQPTDPILADRPFVADLPRRLLAHGALAFIGHVERAWSYSFQSNRPVNLPGVVTPLEAFQRAITRLLDGKTAGYSLRDQHDRGLHLSSSLLEDIAARRRRTEIPELVLANKWIDRNDARSYILLGDPAVRMRVEDLGKGGRLGPVPGVTLPAPGAGESAGPAAPTGPAEVERIAVEPGSAGVRIIPGRPAHELREGGGPVDPSSRARRDDPEPRDATGRQRGGAVGPRQRANEPPESFLPTVVTGQDDRIDKKLLEAWSAYIQEGFRRNGTMFQRVLSAFIWPYWLTVAMYAVLFMIGIGSFLVGAYLAAAGQHTFAAIFGGLSATAVLTFFISGPLRSLEQNLSFITWLGIIYNTYWTQLMYANDLQQVRQELETITKTAIRDLNDLVGLHTRLASGRPGLPTEGDRATDETHAGEVRPGATPATESPVGERPATERPANGPGAPGGPRT